MTQQLASSLPHSGATEGGVPVTSSSSASGMCFAESDSDSEKKSRCGPPSTNNSLQSLEEEEEAQQQQQEDEEEAPEAPRAAQQPLPPPPLAAFTTGASSGSSSSSGRRRFSAARLRATTSGGSRTPPAQGTATGAAAAAAAACLPGDDNLYDSLVRYQAENDDSTTVSMGETLRSVSTWYSVQSDDDRKIPARPTEGTYEGTYREPIRRPYGRPSSSNGASNNNSSASNSSGSSTNTPGLANSNVPPRATGGAGAGAGAGRYPPPAVATRRTSSGSMSRSVASGPPPVVWEEEKDDHTAISSLANNTADRSEEESAMNALPRWPLGGIDEGCAEGTNNNNINNSNANSEFACLSAAAQLAQEANMGNMVETTRSAPTPFAEGATRFSGNPGGTEWDSMDWTFPSLVQHNDPSLVSHDEAEAFKSPPPPPPGGGGPVNPNRNRMSNTAASTRSIEHSPNPPPAPEPSPPMNDYTRMQQTLGMQDLCVPGSTNHSLNGSEQSGRSSLRRNRSGRGQQSPPVALGPPQPSQPSVCSSILSIDSSQGTPSVASNAIEASPVVNNTAAAAASSSKSSDPAAQEQYQIWQQIQEEQERKQMELALQLSQTVAATGHATRMDPNSGFDYPAQNAKKSAPQLQSGAGEGELDEEEALKVALRISQEETHAGGNDEEEEDEIALALRLSKEQAEEDEKRFQQMQETELSEEEQLKLAMEQSMNQSGYPQGGPISGASSLPAHTETEGDDEEMRRALAESLQRSDHNDSPEHGDGDDVDEDMALALRLSQAQMEEEERFRQSFLEPPNATEAQAEEPVMGSESFSQLIQPFPGEVLPPPPLGRSTSRRGAPQDPDDTEIVPPVRSRPSQEPASPGLTPPGQVRDSPVRRLSRRMFGRRAGGLPPEKMDIPGAIPPHRPSLEDLESLSAHVRETFEQQQMKHADPRENQRELIRAQSQQFAHPAKIHAPDDGCDMPPVSRPQRKDNGGKQPRATRSWGSIPDREAHINNVVDIDSDSRDVLVREGQSETRAAIMQGQSQIVTCRGCFGKLHAPMNCSLVFCPTCNTVSQVSNLGI